MARLRLLLLCCLVALGVSAHERPTVALVLCGGGAKGAAHVGAIKVIEEMGLSPDIVVGTSMGAIVGGLYSVGYSPEAMDSLIRAQDWSFLLSDRILRSERSFYEKEFMERFFLSVPIRKKMRSVILGGGVVRGQNISTLFSDLTAGVHDSISFDSLPRRFACVAYDASTGEPVVFHGGNLRVAMRASMSIPGMFVPVRSEGRVLVDGMMADNFPVDVARAMGADVVIGVDLQDDLIPADELDGVIPMLSQLIDLSTNERYRRNVEDTDIYIKVNVKGYSSASFNASAIDALIYRGEVAARQQTASLRALADSLNAPVASVPDSLPSPSFTPPKSFPVRQIHIHGLDERDTRRILRKSHLSEGEDISLPQIHRAISMMYAILHYAFIDYRLISNPLGDYDLHFSVFPKLERTVSVGLRFDSEEIAAVLLNFTHTFPTHTPIRLVAEGRLGKRSYLDLSSVFNPSVTTDFNFRYRFSYNDIDLNDHGSRLCTATYRHHLIDFNLSKALFYYRMLLRLGVRYEHYGFTRLLSNSLNPINPIAPEGHSDLLSYYATLRYDSMNERVFPTRGSRFSASYALSTDNGVRYQGGTPFSTLMAEWSTVIPLTRRFALLPSASGRILWGDLTPYPYLNVVGGFSSAHYLPQQIAFAGIPHIEVASDAVFVPAVTLRQRLWQRHFISLTGNLLFMSSEPIDIFTDRPYVGVSLAYAYNSFFGPLGAQVFYSNRIRRLGFYFNLGFYF